MLRPMRLAFLLPVSVALGTAALIVAHSAPEPSGSLAPASGSGDPHESPHESLTDIGVYRDPELAFDLAVPAGWTAIEPVADPPGDAAGGAGSGHAVVFEAPRDGPGDAFADYVMIEILPGRDSGLFLTDGSRAADVRIDGMPGTRDALVIEGHEVDGVVLDLVVHQAEVRGLGWTIGFYAIGETRRERLVEDAFELMIRTFRLPAPPFRVTRVPVAPQRVG